MSPRSPISTEQLRALKHYSPKKSDESWHAVSGGDSERSRPGFLRQNAAIVAVTGAVAVALCFLGWTAFQRFERVSRQLEQTRLELSRAEAEVARVKEEFASASVVHNLWGLGSQFAADSAMACAADDDRARLRVATASAVEMWSDSDVRSEIDLEGSLIPVLRKLESQGVHVAGASLPAGVVAQYRRFHRDTLGDVVMLDPSRIVDSDSRAAVLGLLRRLSDGGLDPKKTTIVYRFDDYGNVSYPLVQGSSDETLLQAQLSNDPAAQPVTISAADYPCS